MRIGPSVWTIERARALIVWQLLYSSRSTRIALAVIAGFAAIGWVVLIGLKFGQHLFMDCAEAFAWGRHFLAGYGRHPPLTGWIAGAWYKIFPAESWASYGLSRAMCGLCLFGIYLVARRVLDHRRSLFVVIVMFVCPLMLGFKSDRYNNYQVLQAVVPFAVLSFLVAWEKRTVLSGVLLGLAGALATLSIYSGAFIAVATGIAALAHRDRKNFFKSSAPYAAIAVYVVALVPHLIWLWQHDFASLKFASRYVGVVSEPIGPTWNYLFYQITLLCLPVGVALIAMWPLKFSNRAAANANPDVFLLAVVVAVLTLGPPLAFLSLGTYPSGEWGNPFFTLVPVIILVFMPRLIVSRRAISGAALIVSGIAAAYLIIAATYPWINFRARPGYEPYDPVAQLSQAVTEAWRERMHTPLPIVISDLEHASHVAFYSKDHPSPIPDFAPYQAPWIANPGDLRKFGYAGICPANDKSCVSSLQALDAQFTPSDHVRVTASRRFAGVVAPAVSWDVYFVAPKP